ncbi:tryptophan--tRNA ligase [Mycoplasma phocimorsus]|uniref:tryptophan--tRNA ligase n=1 Tax=Mycoplasma phocimorsus TaxID=3045839 RepID=UPI0024C075E8|nr:tryptophan--tRNA ligase [Mycoplasma phocimorsus]MDJ1646371.1 tryptophan--tRNA ligase [Mycoplasma phocimorsus]MDJ1647064.1 tryptophan--tRNA ligase [Mycoplasma phocimorsus]
MNNAKKLVSGITATGKLTLGNYLGAIKNFVKLQHEYDSYFFVADLHALTIEISPSELRKNRKDIFALYLACGIDPEKSTIFFQSDVSQHSELYWILTNNSTIGELSRMTQFKDKSSKIKNSNGTESVPTGLFMYPILMASDILLYNADIIPVGHDQIQHVELTRNLANRINNKYNLNLTLPNAFVSKVGAKIKSLTNPEKKMSKSDENSKSTIYLLDDPNIAYNKIMKAVTDSENKIYISNEKPGITNLLTIYASLNEITIQETENIFKEKSYFDLKQAVANDVKNLLIEIQKKYQESLKNIDKYSKIGAQKACYTAKKVMNKIYKKIGLGDKNESK